VIPVVVGIKLPDQLQLLEVVHAKDPLGLGLGLRQGGQQHPGENGDDRDHHQQFNEGKRGGTGGLAIGIHNDELSSVEL
jgi:hypothetical protein